MAERNPDGGTPCAGVRSVLTGADPRVKLLVALALGVLIWRAGWPGLAVYVTALGALALLHRDVWPGGRHLLRTYLFFVLFWSGSKFLLGLWGASDWRVVGLAALLAAARISCLLLLGTVLTMTTSERAMGRGLSALLRPLLGAERSWRLALSFALMAHFLPLTWRTVEQVRRSVRLRCPGMPLRRRVPLLVQAVLRSLGRVTWDQSLAIAGRGLDRSEAWRTRLPFRPLPWLAGALVVLASAGLAQL